MSFQSSLVSELRPDLHLTSSKSLPYYHHDRALRKIVSVGIIRLLGILRSIGMLRSGMHLTGAHYAYTSTVSDQARYGFEGL